MAILPHIASVVLLGNAAVVWALPQIKQSTLLSSGDEDATQDTSDQHAETSSSTSPLSGPVVGGTLGALVVLFGVIYFCVKRTALVAQILQGLCIGERRKPHAKSRNHHSANILRPSCARPHLLVQQRQQSSTLSPSTKYVPVKGVLAIPSCCRFSASDQEQQRTLPSSKQIIHPSARSARGWNWNWFVFTGMSGSSGQASATYDRGHDSTWVPGRKHFGHEISMSPAPKSHSKPRIHRLTPSPRPAMPLSKQFSATHSSQWASDELRPVYNSSGRRLREAAGIITELQSLAGQTSIGKVEGWLAANDAPTTADTMDCSAEVSTLSP